MADILQTFHEIKKQIITPYVPNVIDVNHPEAMYKRPAVPRSERSTLVYFSGRCTPLDEGNFGKKMRHDVVGTSAKPDY